MENRSQSTPHAEERLVTQLLANATLVCSTVLVEKWSQSAVEVKGKYCPELLADS